MNEMVAVVEAEFSAEYAAKLVVERIITKIEKSDPNFHRKEIAAANSKVKSLKLKFVGRQSKPTLTWAEKCNRIYFHLHPNLGNRSCDLTCKCLFLMRKPC